MLMRRQEREETNKGFFFNFFKKYEKWWEYDLLQLKDEIHRDQMVMRVSLIPAFRDKILEKNLNGFVKK